MGFSSKAITLSHLLSKARSRASKKRGLPEKLLRFQEKKRQEKMDAAVLEGPTDPVSHGTLEVKGKAPVKRRAKTKAPAKKRANRKAE